MSKPRAGIVNMAFAELPVSGAVKMPQHQGLRLREKAFGESVCAFTACKPAADDVERALRRPETMEQPAQVFIANPLAAQDGRCELAHGA